MSDKSKRLSVNEPQLKLTWHDVLDGKKIDGFIADGISAALLCGYEYLSWNGRIYRITSDGDEVDTGLPTKVLDY